MATSEIEKLERRYAENPQGLTFAPLAEVHRKNGDVARALELLTAGLELHPNYIPASIVLGRCHQDLGDLSAAEAAFAHVLRLDDENVIALKSLADINERQERFEDAESWLRRLVSVDRSNDEAREQLRRVETAKNGDRPPTDPALDIIEPGAGAEDDAWKQGDEERPKRPSAEVVALDLPPVDIAALDLTESSAESRPRPEAEAPPPEPAEPTPFLVERAGPPEEKPPEPAPVAEEREPISAEPVEPMAGLITQEFEPPKEIVGNPKETLGIDVETSEDVVLEGSGGSEYRVEDASEDLISLAARLAGTREPPLVEEPAPTARTLPAPEPKPVAEPAAAPLNVASDTKGQSVAAYFRTMLAVRPPSDTGVPGSMPASPTAAAGGAPTRPAQDGLSLGSVFGEEGLPVPPAVPGPDQNADAGVSFDDFFNSKTEGSGTGKPGSDPGNDDLDQFHSWLQNLKR